MLQKIKIIIIMLKENKILDLLKNLIFSPRLKVLKWSCLTKQTPSLKIGYIGQHLASLITGIEGERTGARGNDLADGTEVKSCSRVDQLDTCYDCGGKVFRSEKYCPHENKDTKIECKSEKIDRKNDSKWLFSVKNESELSLLINGIDRILLILADYPKFKDNNFEDIRIQAFEIWPKSSRNKNFSLLLKDYYKIFLTHKNNKEKKTSIAPMNFWPDLIQFYLCNPIQVFECIAEKCK